jgi:hypothetical protein
MVENLAPLAWSVRFHAPLIIAPLIASGMAGLVGPLALNSVGTVFRDGCVTRLSWKSMVVLAVKVLQLRRETA